MICKGLSVTHSTIVYRLRVQDMQAADGGVYKCIARSIAGNRTTSARITVQGGWYI